MTGKMRGRRLTAVAGVLTLLTGLALQVAVMLAPPASGAPSAPGSGTDVSYTLQGCRGSTADYLPGTFVCPDAIYTNGNLGKGWNELDQVPGRVTLETGKNHPAAESFQFVVAVDALKGGVPGFDRLSTLVPNTGLSTLPLATVTVSAPSLASPGVGGTDASIYRLVTVTGMQPSATIVFDFTARPATGSHLYPGSSLHFNLVNADLGTAGIGARDVSVPIAETGTVPTTTTTTTTVPVTTTTTTVPVTTTTTTSTTTTTTTVPGTTTTTTTAPPVTTVAPTTAPPTTAGPTTTRPETSPGTGTTTTVPASTTVPPSTTVTTPPAVTTVPPTTAPGLAASTGSGPTASPGTPTGVLAFTGSHPGRTSTVALALVAAGAALVLVSRPRNPRWTRRS